MDLRHYEQFKFGLAEVLRAIPWRPEQAVRNRDLFARLAEDRFNLAVVGRYSRGKSTLMNAMLGLDRLPTGVEPLTSVITSVTYGSDERVVLHFADTSLFLDVRLEQLPEYITERGNPGNRRRIAEAEVQLPAELLRRGFRFVDTPGLGSMVVENTRTTEAFLHEADAFIVVTGFDGPFTEEEARLLDRVHRSGQRCFIVMNKADVALEDERNRLLHRLRAALEAIGLDPHESVFIISARDALAARLAKDDAALAASGLPGLEATVVAFLVNDKRREFLLGMCARLEAVLAEEMELDVARQQLMMLKERIEQAASLTSAMSLAEEPLPARIPSCGICHHVEQAVFDFLTRLQNLLRKEASAREDLVHHGGMCGPHARQIAALTAPREICTGFAPVLLERASRLRAAAETELPAYGLADMMPGYQGCPACAVSFDAQKTAAKILATRIRSEPEGISALSALCLPHLDGFAIVLDDVDLLRRVFRHQAQILERLAEDMGRFAVKQDASRRDEMSEEEKAASHEGIHVLVGRPNADQATARAGTRAGRDELDSAAGLQSSLT